MNGHESQKTRPNRFGPVLRGYIDRAGMSQSKTAERANLDHSMVSRMCSGDRHPTRGTVNDLSTALGLGKEDRDVMLAAAGFLSDDQAFLWIHPGVIRLGAALKALSGESDAGQRYADVLIRSIESTAETAEFARQVFAEGGVA